MRYSLFHLQMILDERLDKIASLIGQSLNDEAAPAKVRCAICEFIPAHNQTVFQGGLNAVNARVYAVKVSIA